MSCSESGKNWLGSTKRLNPLGWNWYESTKNMNLSETAGNWCRMAKNGFEKSKSWVGEEVRGKGVSDKHKDLLIKGSGALLLAPAIGWMDGFGKACGYLLSYAATSDDCCAMAKDNLEKSESWVEGEIRTKGISVENSDLLFKAGGALLVTPAIVYFGGLGSACVFLIKCAASDNGCQEMAKNRFEKSMSWVETGKNGFERIKSWAEEKIREKGISDHNRDLALKGGGALLLAAATYGGLGGAYGFIFGGGGGGSGDGQKLMKAPGRPGEFIARAAFEANPRAYFQGLRNKL